MQQRQLQLQRTLGLSDKTGRAPGGRTAPALDVLASLSAKAGRAQKRPRSPLGWWLALPLLGLALWWVMTSGVDPAPSPLPPPALVRGAETVAAAVTAPAATPPVPPAAAAAADADPATQAADADPLSATAAPSAPSTPRSALAATVVGSDAPSAAAGPAESADASNISADTDARVALQSTLERWRQAWAARDVQAYLGHYARTFVPANGQPRAQWVASRRRIIGSRSAIALSLSQIELKSVAADRWQARFLQDYASDGYVEKQLPKTLELVREDGQWRIAAERSGAP